MIGTTISHYKVLGQIGEGGMGVVYVAEDTSLRRRVAIKIPHAGKNESHYRARFLREARAVSKLTHTNIATVHDLGETEDGQPYIVMELVTGLTLGEILAGPGLSVARSVEIIREVAEALSEAHSHKIIHRDVKPSNVIIGERGEVKVLDFGLAKQLDEDVTRSRALSEHTRSDVVIGTPLYLSPEQARGAKVDARSDLFALGALLYECVTGRPAFSGANVIEIGAQVLHFDPPPPSRFNPRVPADLDRVVRRALAKRPEDRFQTAEEFSQELSRVRAKLPDSDDARTRRLTGSESLTRSSALITMTEGLRRKRFSSLTVIGVVALLAAAAAAFYYVTLPSVHAPKPEAVALYELGVEAMREGANQKATVLLDQAVHVDADYALAHARLAEALTELEFSDRAKDEMIVATTLVPNIRALGREDALYFDAVRATVARHYAEAVEKYKALVEMSPNLPQRLVDLGRACVKADDTKCAADAFTRASSDDPAYATASLSLGVLHARTKNLPGATEAFDRAERLYSSKGNHEGEAEVHYQRGRLFVELSNYEDARRELGEALTLARSTDNAYQQVQAMLQLSYVQEPAEGQTTAGAAIELAQARGMPSLVARGYTDLGIQCTRRRDYEQAERNFKRALVFAGDYKARRLEALARFMLASIYEKLNRLEEAGNLAEQARDFYSHNGFRKETALAVMLSARVRARLGDYKAALEALEDQLKSNESSGDAQLLGQLHRECGSVLAKQDRFAEATRHYREAVATGRRLNDEQLLTYSLLNLAGALWRVGHYDEATQTLAQLSDIASKRATPDKEILARASLVEAYMALSQGHFGDARSKGSEVLAAAQDAGGRKDMTTEADALMCLADALGGAPSRGRPFCDDAARVAGETGDPLFISNAKLALAEALLEEGDAQGALAAATDAEKSFAQSGRLESDWRALAVAGKAARRLGDEAAARDYFTRAAAQLSRLEQSWGEEAAGYLSRQDVQRLRRELGDDAVAEAR